MKTFKYKDANRVWWRLEVEMDRPEVPSVFEDGELVALDDADHWWKYKLINEDTDIVFCNGEVWGQYKIMPDITQFLEDIQSQVNHLCLGMAKYCDVEK